MMKLSRIVLAFLLIQSFVAGISTDKQIARAASNRIVTKSITKSLPPKQLGKSSPSVTIEAKTVRWQSGKKGNGFPQYRETIVRYPVVSGLVDPEVLKKVRSAISLKTIVGQSLTELRQDDSNWLTEIDYVVNYNRHNIFDLTYIISGMGAYPSTSKKRVSIDLNTGKLLQAKDLFKADSNEAIAQTIEQMMQQEIRSKIVELRKQAPDLKPDLFAKYHFRAKDLNNFTIGKQGVTFHYNFDFIHAIKVAEPNGSYFITYEKLNRYIRPDGAIGFAFGRSK
jgi:hypothetical protein